jgi:hypothetical protein
MAAPALLLSLPSIARGGHHAPSRPARRARTAAGVAVAAALLVAAACSDDDGDDGGAAAGDGTTSTTAGPELPAGYEGYTGEVYADDAHWLCKPGLTDDVCSRDLDATAVAAEGTAEVVAHEADPDAPVDCFYVYPTTSHDPAINSDFTPGEAEEIGTVYNQVARLNSACRVFAPIYRQVTLSGIGGARPADGTDPGPWPTATSSTPSGTTSPTRATAAGSCSSATRRARGCSTG